MHPIGFVLTGLAGLAVGALVARRLPQSYWIVVPAYLLTSMGTWLLLVVIITTIAPY